VVATGSPGAISDFESVIFTTPLNALTQDGRSGFWLFYPSAGPTGEVTTDPADASNSVVRFAWPGSTVAWAGVALQFLADGDETYDASAYAGVRFKIKGYVDSVAQPQTVTFSVISAETQTAALGGCLPAGQEIDNFDKTITLGSSSSPETSFQQFDLLWGDLDLPNWSTPAGYPLPTQPAVDKLMLIEWGVDQDATDVEIYLDDVELIE